MHVSRYVTTVLRKEAFAQEGRDVLVIKDKLPFMVDKCRDM